MKCIWTAWVVSEKTEGVLGHGLRQDIGSLSWYQKTKRIVMLSPYWSAKYGHGTYNIVVYIQPFLFISK